ncbi:hypothetical protein DFH29DRAFT_901981 [Suillus ampliporus]|nr:hypothetical protein DFH29DRAFT_901981 [Suillus ampliporus]
MQLLSCFPGHLLPNLRVLSPSSWGIRKCVAVALLASSCPLLKKFTCANAEDSSMQAISEAVVGLNKLESLLVGPLDEQALTHAASLQTLQELWFSISDLRSPVVKLCSPHYCISAPSPSFFYTFLRNVHFSTQRLLLFCRHHDDDDEQLHDHFFSRLQACFIHPEGLLELRLALKKIPHDEASFESVLVNDAVMQPLLSFTGLNFLDLADICTAYVNDTLLEEIALACPHLRELHLGDRGWWPIKPYATFKGVVSLSKHCRQLSTLGIFFDATFIINMPQVDAVNPNITDFLVGASDIDDPMKVAAVLSFLIPNAAIDHCILNSSPPDFQRTKEMWESVNTWLETFVSVRNHGWEQGWLEGRAAVEKNAVA